VVVWGWVKNGTYIQLRANAYNKSRKVVVKVPEDKANILQEYVSVYRALKRLKKVEKLLLSVVDLIRGQELWTNQILM
jgi:hypothetical protein